MAIYNTFLPPYSRGVGMEIGRIIGGSILLLLGIAFLLTNYGLLSEEIWKLWPLILIIIGVGILSGGRWGKGK
jgi:hypothetical protein